MNLKSWLIFLGFPGLLAAQNFPDGFETSVFAASPDVENPIAMAWDWRGRLWVADKAQNDRVLIFEDSDWDGKADKRTVFAEDLQNLTSIEFGHGGVWLLCPPQLLFVEEDAEPVVMLDGFGKMDGELRWGPDGWLYGSRRGAKPGLLGVPEMSRVPIYEGIWRFHPASKMVEIVAHGRFDSWGHDWDKFGEFFAGQTRLSHGAHCDSTNPLVFAPIEIKRAANFGGYEVSEGPDGSFFGFERDGAKEILRFSRPGISQKPDFSDLANLSGEGCERLVKNPNPWFTRQLLQRLVEKIYHEDYRTRDSKGAPTVEMAALKKEIRAAMVAMIDSPDEKPIHRFRAWSAYSWFERPRSWTKAEHEHLRAWAIRLVPMWIEREFPLDTIDGLRPKNAIGSIQDMRVGGYWFAAPHTAGEEKSKLVRLEIASSLQRMPHDGRAATASGLASHAEDAGDEILPKLVWFGILPLARTSPDELVEVAAASTWPDLTRWIARALGTNIENLSSPVEALLELGINDPEKAPAIISGLSEAFQDQPELMKPTNWDAIVSAFPDNPTVRKLDKRFKN